MTDQKPPPALVEPEPGSRLDQLTAEWARVKPAVDAGQARLKEITDAIKVELANQRPDSEDTRLLSSHVAGSLRFYAKPTTRLDTTKLKADLPAVYEAYVKRGTAWELRQTT